MWLLKRAPLIQSRKCTLAKAHLLSSQCLAVALQEIAHHDGAYNGKALACFQLGGKSEQVWMLHVEVLIQL